MKNKSLTKAPQGKAVCLIAAVHVAVGTVEVQVPAANTAFLRTAPVAPKQTAAVERTIAGTQVPGSVHCQV
jgi:hypothetical protein